MWASVNRDIQNLKNYAYWTIVDGKSIKLDINLWVYLKESISTSYSFLT